MAPKRPSSGFPPFLIGGVLLLLGTLFWMILEPVSPPMDGPAQTTHTFEEEPGSQEKTPAVATVDPSEYLLPGEGPVQVELRYLGGQQEERIAPKQGGRLEGFVKTPAQEPLAGARLVIVGGPQDGWSAVTRGDGSFLFPDILPGAHFFQLEHKSMKALRVHRVKPIGTTRRSFILGPPISFSVLVRDSKNEALPGAQVFVDGGLQQEETDEDGRVWFHGVASGPRVLIGVRADGLVPVRQELNLYASPQKDVELPPLRKGGVLRGHVKSWPGSPLPVITVAPRTAAIQPYQVIWETWQAVEVSSDGHFLLKDLPTNQLMDVRVFHPGGVGEPRVRAVRPDPRTSTTISFIVKQGVGKVAGKVKDADGFFLRGAQVVLESANPVALLKTLYPALSHAPSLSRLPMPAALRREVSTNSNGAFTFAVGDHPKGTGALVLTVTAPGHQPFRQSIKRAYEKLEIQLWPENRAASLQLDFGKTLDLPPVEWFLDGASAKATKALQLDALLAGYYEVTVRRGDLVLIHEPEFSIGRRTHVKWDNAATPTR